MGRAPRCKVEHNLFDHACLSAILPCSCQPYLHSAAPITAHLPNALTRTIAVLIRYEGARTSIGRATLIWYCSEVDYDQSTGSRYPA